MLPVGADFSKEGAVGAGVLGDPVAAAPVYSLEDGVLTLVSGDFDSSSFGTDIIENKDNITSVVANPGVTLTGNCTELFANFTACESIDLSNVDTTAMTNCSSMFAGCSSLTSIDLTNFYTANVSWMGSMFSGCTSLETIDLSSFDTANVRYIDRMFQNCESLTSIDLSGFVTPGLESIAFMFDNCTSLTTIDLRSFDTANVYNMSYLCHNCSSLENFLIDETKFNTAGNQYFNAMFTRCTNLPAVDVSHFDTSNAVNLSYMFYGCSNLTEIDVSHFDTTHVTNMEYMFYECSNVAEIDVSHFDTSNVTDMSCMFSFCSGITVLDVSHFDTSRCTNMYMMFRQCSHVETLDVSNFDTSRVTNMGSMFSNCNALSSLDVSGFDTSNVTNMRAMFFNNINVPVIDVSGFDTALVEDFSLMFSGCNTITELDVSGFQTGNGTNMEQMFQGCVGVPEIDVSGFDTARVTSMRNMFYNCRVVNPLDVSGFDTGEVTDMSNMFSGCQSVTNLDVSGFDTHNVTDMHNMFYNCAMAPVIDVSNFDTAKVTSMNYIFYNCKTITVLDVSGFDTREVTDMKAMFYQVEAVPTIDVSGFNTEKVTDMEFLFSGCKAVTHLDVSGFDTSNVTNMGRMFQNCYAVDELDVSSFNTENVTSMSYMFQRCQTIDELDLSNFNTANVENMRYMFHGCSKLEKLDISGFELTSIGGGTEETPELNYYYMFYQSPKLCEITLNAGFPVTNGRDSTSMFLNNGDPSDKGWVKKGSTNGSVISGTTANARITAPSVDTTYIWKTNAKYNVTWKNYNGTTLETDKNVPYGTTPTYNSATPVKPGLFVFTGWTPDIAPVSKQITYTAVFRPINNLIVNYRIDASQVNPGLSSSAAFTGTVSSERFNVIHRSSDTLNGTYTASASVDYTFTDGATGTSASRTTDASTGAFAMANGDSAEFVDTFTPGTYFMLGCESQSGNKLRYTPAVTVTDTITGGTVSGEGENSDRFPYQTTIENPNPAENHTRLTVDYANTVAVNSLTIGKKLSFDDGASRTFTLKAELSLDGGATYSAYPLQYTDSSSHTGALGTDGTVTLHADESVTITGVPAGATVRVSEPAASIPADCEYGKYTITGGDTASAYSNGCVFTVNHDDEVTIINYPPRYTVRYHYTDRDNNAKYYDYTDYYKPGDTKLENLSDDDAAIFVSQHAPEESVFSKNMVWDTTTFTKSTQAVSQGKVDAEITAVSTTNTVTVNYPDFDNDAGTGNDAFSYLSTSAAYNTVPFVNGDYITAPMFRNDPSYNTAREFTYWKIERADGMVNTHVELSRCYFRSFNFSAEYDCFITPVYTGKYDLTDDGARVSLTFLDYTRDQWSGTQSGGDLANGKANDTDKLYADYEMAFSLNGPSVNENANVVKCGMVYEICGQKKAADLEAFLALPESDRLAAYNTNTANLQNAVLNGSTSFNAGYKPSVKLNYGRNLKGELSPMGRVEYYMSWNNNNITPNGDGTYTNTYTNARYIFKAYAYMIYKDSTGTNRIVMSDPIMVNHYESAIKD